MKLRNKKTGGVGKIASYDVYKGIFAVNCDGKTEYYYTLAELNEEWEDYESKEPLIKDEKIRNALRAWAGANELSVVRVFYIDETETLKLDSGVNLIAISFESEEDYSHLNRETHTIAELCGEEE